MKLNKATATAHLKAFDFATLFIEELGWDRPGSRHNEAVNVGNTLYALSPVAEKRGVRIFVCATEPDRNTRQRIEREITKLAFEHLIIFTDPAKTKQIWQWVAREKGKPAAFREHTWLAASAPDALIQKLDHIAFALSEEEGLTLAGTTLRMRDAFDREKITKRFYEAFKQQHDKFLGFIDGLANVSDRQWYASLMLNRLMFVYFIQKKGFLDGDINYLKNRLTSVRATKGEDQFHSFYRAFLLKLFHGGLATPTDARDAETAKLLGNIPYLNGGLFEPHALEADGNTIAIADAAFEGVFTFFDQYEWTLDTRAIERADGREINPDVLGHIFEKYINQKQMGAYYTKEDITDYITKNTVIPWLFQNALTHDKVAFEAGSAVWRMLSENPDAYIYNAVKHGADETLPDNIAAGILDVAKRGDWNKTAPATHGLPTEIWREVVARRERYEAIKAKAAAGEIALIEDFITLNLDIRQFARDAIQYAESPDLVRAFWKGISAIKVLDPACGSGAFLFAALGILYDLYDACLDRMEQFVDSAPERGGPRQLYSDFRTVLDQIERHPNRPYFIYKSIILDNLYGVDIMDEAVEICKLRLFLKLASQLERADQIEPLPDIDFNIRAGNTLIGYTSFADVERATNAAGLDFDGRAEKIKSDTEDYASALEQFRRQQTELGSEITPEDKENLKSRLAVIKPKLDRYLAQDYGVQAPENVEGVLADSANFLTWKSSHKPFHWLIEFYGIINGGGFDVVVGNPPYIVYTDNKFDYTVNQEKTQKCGNLYAFFCERSVELLDDHGSISVILPNSSISADKMTPVQDILTSNRKSWVSNFSWRPAKLFEDADMLLAIIISCPTKNESIFSTRYMKWYSDYRSILFETITYQNSTELKIKGSIPKIPFDGFSDILKKMEAVSNGKWLSLGFSKEATSHRFFYFRAVQYWLKALDRKPIFFENGIQTETSEMKPLYVTSNSDKFIYLSILSSTTYFVHYAAWSSCQVINSRDFQMPFDRVTLSDQNARKLAKLGEDLQQNYQDGSKTLTRTYAKKGREFEMIKQHFYISRSKPIIDEIDAILADHYAFSADEQDRIINYDIKYRVGADADDAD